MTGWLSDTFVYTGVLIAVVLVLRRPVARVFGAQVAYALWALPFLRLLLPPIVLPASMAPAQTLPAPQVMTGSADMGVIAPAAPMIDWTAVALAVWLGGAAVFLAWRVVEYRRMRAAVLASARPVGEVGKVRMVETPGVDSPVAFGVGDKVIALPLLFMASPDLAARDLAIAHELEHHRGYDLAANFAAQAVLALHWFNPIAWLGWRAMRYDQEAACDARVLAGRCHEERARYAHLIAYTGAGRRPNPLKGALAAPMACPVLGDASIVHRLKSLTMTDISPRRRWVGRAFVLSGMLALPLTATLCYAQAEPGTAPDGVKKQIRITQVAPGTNAANAKLHTHEINRDGARIVLKTDRVLTDAEVTEKVDMALAGLREPPEGAFPPLPPVAPVPPMPPVPPVPGIAPVPPAPPAMSQEMRTIIRRQAREGAAASVREFALRREGMADVARERALARIPEISEDCSESGPSGTSETVLPNGRKRIVICERRIHRNAITGALSGLRGARDQLAGNPRLRPEALAEELEELDEAILELERELK